MKFEKRDEYHENLLFRIFIIDIKRFFVNSQDLKENDFVIRRPL